MIYVIACQSRHINLELCLSLGGNELMSIPPTQLYCDLIEQQNCNIVKVYKKMT